MIRNNVVDSKLGHDLVHYIGSKSTCEEIKGYEFIGWMVNGDIVLIARWDKNGLFDCSSALILRMIYFLITLFGVMLIIRKLRK